MDLPADTVTQLGEYYSLLTRWNERLHLVAPCEPEEFAVRHVLESLLLLEHLPPNARIADIGSGGGLPIIPCLIARTDLQAVLVESSNKKAVFLREALKEIEVKERAQVIADRFEHIPPPEVDFVSCRALERFEAMVPQIIKWTRPNGTLRLFGGEGLGSVIEDLDLPNERILLPKSARRFLFIVKKGSRKLS